MQFSVHTKQALEICIVHNEVGSCSQEQYKCDLKLYMHLGNITARGKISEGQNVGKCMLSKLLQ